MENTAIKIDWYADIDKVSSAYKARLNKKSGLVILDTQAWGILFWDYEEGLSIETSTNTFAECLAFLKTFHKKHKIKEYIYVEGSKCSVIHAETTALENIPTATEEVEFFTQFGLERDGEPFGYPLPKKKPSHGVGKGGDKSIKVVSGATERSLTVSYYPKTLSYTGVFIKSVSGVVKVQASIVVERTTSGELILLSAADKLRKGIRFPKDTFASIDKQINELYRRKS